MTDLRELYQQVILEHSRKPRNFRKPEVVSHSAEGNNPLCGDQLTVYLSMQDGRVHDIGFDGSGCAISRASASLMTTVVKGKTQEEAEGTFQKFREMVTRDRDTEVDLEHLGKLAALSGVRDFPVRVKCATLAWHTLHAALSGERQEVTTE